MKFTRSAIVALVLLGMAHAQSTAPASIRVHNLKLEPQFAYDVLAKLSKKYHVVIGVSGKLIPSRGTEVPINVSLKDGTLAQLFDMIVAADQNYTWTTTSSGSVHFVVGGPLALLQIPVRTFDGKKFSRFDAAGISQIPEVRAWLQKNRCVMSHALVFLGDIPEEWPAFEVHTKGVPLAAVLDEIALKSGEYFWSLILSSDEHCKMDVQF